MEPVSKSQKKREADSLKKIGVELIALSVDKLNSLPLTESLYQAIISAKSINSHGAKRRQAQLIGKLMRSADYEAIIEALAQFEEEDSAVSAHFHQIELWREQLISGGKDAFTQFVDLYHPEDLQELRKLIAKAVDELQASAKTGAAKALFRRLRLIIK